MLLDRVSKLAVKTGFPFVKSHCKAPFHDHVRKCETTPTGEQNELFIPQRNKSISSDHFLLSRIQLCLPRPKLVYKQVTVNRWNSDSHKKNHSSCEEWSSNCYWFISFWLIDVGAHASSYLWHSLDKWVSYSFVESGLRLLNKRVSYSFVSVGASNYRVDCIWWKLSFIRIVRSVHWWWR